MKITQSQWTPGEGWNGAPSDESNLVIAFGATDILSSPERMSELSSRHPGASVIGCSTAGEICGTRVTDETLNVTSIRFERGVRVATVKVSLAEVGESSHAVGLRIAQRLPKDGLAHVFVLSCGLNGSQLTRGLVESLPDGVGVTGGLSGDGTRFARTLVLLDGEVSENSVIAVGFYGPLRVGCGSMGGWDPFGPDRIVTRSEGNVVYELDGQSALGLYKQYLGDHAKGLPSSGLLFPLSVRVPGGDTRVVRTILGVDEAAQSLTFAGDVPQGSIAQLMKANFDRLVEGAMGAAKASFGGSSTESPELAVLISCVGRKLVLKQRVEEEVEAVREVLGDRTVMTGFYSYGEISPFTPSAKCELHNQTMTVTTFSEL